jgi:hypothetical protein
MWSHLVMEVWAIPCMLDLREVVSLETAARRATSIVDWGAWRFLQTNLRTLSRWREGRHRHDRMVFLSSGYIRTSQVQTCSRQ